MLGRLRHTVALVALLLTTASRVHAGARPFEVLLVDASSVDAGERADHLFTLFQADVKRVFTKANPDGANVHVVTSKRAANVFDQGCSGHIKDKAELAKLIDKTSPDISQDGVVLYCYDPSAKRVTFLVLDPTGAVLTKVENPVYSPSPPPPGDKMVGLIFKNVRTALIAYLVTVFTFSP